MPTKEISVSYAGVTLGGSSGDYHIDGPYTFDESGVEGGKMVGRFSCEVVVVNSAQYTAATFAAACSALEVAFSKPRQDLTVSLGASTLVSWSHGSNTGFCARPSIAKIGAPEDTGRSRRYRVTVEVDLPADLTGQNGRRDSRVEITYDSSRIRTVTISGRYTALGSNSARAQYESASPAYFSSVISGLTGGGTFEIIEEQVNNDDANKHAEFKVTYREIIYAQTSGATDSTTIVRHTVTFARVQPSVEAATKDVRALSTVIATYQAHVDKTVSTDLATIWSGTLRSYVMSQFDTIFNPSLKCVKSENVSIDKTNNTINCSLEFLAIIGSGGDMIDATFVEELQESPGFVFTGSYAGNPVGLHVDVAWHEIFKVTSARYVQRGEHSATDNPFLKPPSTVPGPIGNWYLVNATQSSRIFNLGIPGDPQMTFTEYNYRVTYRYAEKPKGAGAVTTPTTPTTGGTKPPPVTTPSDPVPDRPN